MSLYGLELHGAGGRGHRLDWLHLHSRLTLLATSHTADVCVSAFVGLSGSLWKWRLNLRRLGSICSTSAAWLEAEIKTQHLPLHHVELKYWNIIMLICIIWSGVRWDYFFITGVAWGPMMVIKAHEARLIEYRCAYLTSGWSSAGWCMIIGLNGGRGAITEYLIKPWIRQREFCFNEMLVLICQRSARAWNNLQSVCARTHTPALPWSPGPPRQSQRRQLPKR